MTTLSTEVKFFLSSLVRGFRVCPPVDRGKDELLAQGKAPLPKLAKRIKATITTIRPPMGCPSPPVRETTQRTVEHA